MSILTILQYPDNVLQAKSSPIENIDDETVELANSMIETMYNASGIGLAAPQVGVSKNLLVIDLGVQIENGPAVVMVNPQITEVSNSEVLDEEGCLSIPGIFSKVVRQKSIEVKGTDLKGKEISMEFEELLARAIQHEIDHFNGVLFWDHLGKIKRELLKGKFKKLQKEKQNEENEHGGLY